MEKYMELAAAIILAIGLTFGNIVFFQNEKKYPISESEILNQVTGRKKIIYDVITGILLILMAIYLSLQFTELPFWEFGKRLLLMAVLFAIAYWDYTRQLIPNKILLAGIIGFVLLSAGGLVMNFQLEKDSLVSGLLAGIFLLLIGILVRLIVKNGIGMGDIKLLAYMGLVQGLYGIMNSVILSLVLIFIYCVCLLLTKRKGKKDVVAFAPAILIGTYVSILLVGV